MKITFLGTGTSQGVPVIACDCDVCISQNHKDKRLRSSVMIEIENNIFVIDTGPDFRQQMLRERVTKLDAILYTHSHKDHVAGLDDIRSFNFRSKKAMDLFCTKDVLQALINNSPFLINKIKIVPIQALHYKLPVFGFRINNFIYLTDISYISKEEKLKMFDADVIVLDCLRIEPHMSHLCLSQALDLIKEFKPNSAYLIHISHLMGLHDLISKKLPKNVFLSYDGLQISSN